MNNAFGLMKNYDIDPEGLDFVHDIDMKNLKKDASLKRDIDNLPEINLYILMVMKNMQKNFMLFRFN